MDKPTAYVTADGTYGVGNILIFHGDALTDDQWWKVDSLGDNDRFTYIQAILDKDWETVNNMEDPNA